MEFCFIGQFYNNVLSDAYGYVYAMLSTKRGSQKGDFLAVVQNLFGKVQKLTSCSY